jgi:hypothetical protein
VKAGVQIGYSHPSKNDWMVVKYLGKKTGWGKASGIEVI